MRGGDRDEERPNDILEQHDTDEEEFGAHRASMVLTEARCYFGDGPRYDHEPDDDHTLTHRSIYESMALPGNLSSMEGHRKRTRRAVNGHAVGG